MAIDAPCIPGELRWCEWAETGRAAFGAGWQRVVCCEGFASGRHQQKADERGSQNKEKGKQMADRAKGWLMNSSRNEMTSKLRRAVIFAQWAGVWQGFGGMPGQTM